MHGTRIGEPGKPVEITLVQDVLSKPESVIIDASKNIRLDLDGKTLTTSCDDYVIKNYGTLEIVDNSEDKTGKITSTTNNTIYNGDEDTEEKDSNTPEEKENVPVNLGKVQKFNDSDQYFFEYNKEKDKIINNNNTHNDSVNTIATGYLELDMTKYEGKYELTVDADISNYWSGYNCYGYGYVGISNNPDSIVENGRIINISCFHSNTSSKTYKMDIAGGQKYYLNFRYEKGNESSITVQDEFRINSVTIVKKHEGKLTLTSGTVSIEREGWWNRYAEATYFSAIVNDGILNVKGGVLTSSKKYTAGIKTLEGATSIITEGDFQLRSDNDIAIWSYEKTNVTKVSGGNIQGYYGIKNNNWLGNLYVTGGTFNETGRYQIYVAGPWSKAELKDLTLTAQGNNNIYKEGDYSEIIINNCKINNSSSYAIYNYSSHGTMELNGTNITACNGIEDYYINDTNINKCQITSNNTAILLYNNAYGRIGNYNITDSTINVTVNSSYNSDIITCNNAVNLTITDSTLNNVSSVRDKPPGVRVNGGTLNIKGKTSIKSSGAPIYSSGTNETTINIESGILESTDWQAIEMVTSSGTVNIGEKGGKVDKENPILKSSVSEWNTHSNEMHINFYDGKLIGGHNIIIGAAIDKLEDEYELVEEKYTNQDEEQSEKEFYAVTLGKTEGVAQLVNEGTDSDPKYATLSEAIKACGKKTAQTTIKLLKDVNLSKQVKVENGQNVKIDLNGHKLYVLTDEAIYNEGQLEIVDTTTLPEEEYNIIAHVSNNIIHNAVVLNENEVEYKGILTLGNGVKINSNTSGITNQFKSVIRNEGELNTEDLIISSSGSWQYPVNNTGELEMQGGQVTATNSRVDQIHNDTPGTVKLSNIKIDDTNNSYSYPVYNQGGTIEIDGETIITAADDALHNFGLGTITINEGKITSSAGTTIYNGNENGTIIVNGGIITNTYSSGYVINNNEKGIININGGELNSNGYRSQGIYNWNGGEVNIKEGTIKSVNRAINNCNYFNSGTVNVTGGTIISQNEPGIYNGRVNVSGTVNVTGGTIRSEATFGIQNDSGTLNLGKKIAEDDPEDKEPNQESPSIKGKQNGVYNRDIFNYYDGAITGPVGQAINGNITDKEKGYQIVKTNNEDETETARLKKVYIIQIKEDDTNNIEKSTTIEEFQDKLDKLNESSEGKTYTITILEDFSISSTEEFIIPSELEVTLDINGKTIRSTNNSTITNRGKLTIKDSNTETPGSLENGANGANNQCAKVINNESNATLKMVSGKLLTTGSSAYGIYNCDDGTTEIDSGTIITSGSSSYGIYNSTTGNLTIKGGEIQTGGRDAQGVYNCSQKDTDISGITITVNEGNTHGIHTNNTGKTILHDLTVNSKGYGIYNDNIGTIEINKGSQITSSFRAVDNHNLGTIEINDATINSTSDSAVHNESQGIININSGTMTGYLYGAYNNNGGTINIKTATITSDNRQCIYNSNYMKSGTINIEGATITSKNSFGIYNGKINTTGTINVISGTIISEKSTGIQNEYGELNLGKKSTEESKGEEPSTTDPRIEGKDYGIYNAAIFNYYDGVIKAPIGKFANNNINDKETEYQIVKEIDEDANLETVTLQKVDILGIDGNTYKTIKEVQETINNLTEEEHTIKVLRNFYMCLSDCLEIPEDKNIKINLNGYSIEVSSTGTIKNNGSLKITDESEGTVGKILGTANKIIENNGELVICSGNYNVSNYTGDSSKLIYNTNKLTWENGNLTMNRGNNYGIYNTENGTVEWKDGNVGANATSNHQYVIYTDSTGEINWRNGKIALDSTATRYSQYAIYNKGMGEINIENMTFSEKGLYSSWNNTYQYLVYTQNSNEEKNTINIYNVEAEVLGYSGYYSGIEGSNVILNMYGGNFSKFSNDIILNNSTIFIEEGTYNDIIECRSDSVLTINGGSIGQITNQRATVVINNANIGYLYGYNGGNTTMNGGSIYRENDNAVDLLYGDASFTLLGGTVESANGCGVHIYTDNGAFTMGANDDIVVTEAPSVKGSTNGVYNERGIFNFYDGIIQGKQRAINGAVSDKPEIYKVQYDEGETIAILSTIAEIENIISVGKVYFSNMQSAIGYATNISGTIVLHKNLEKQNALTIPANANITINLNAHDLLADIQEPLITNNGNLTIIDEPIDNIDDDAESIEAKIKNTEGYAIDNNNILTIGVSDKNINPITPSISGAQKAINNKGILNLYDGKIDGESITEEGTETAEGYNVAKQIKANAGNVIQGLQNAIQVAVQSPKIKLDKELPIWTKESVNATIYTTGRIQLDIVNIAENVELQSITVKKVWEMPDEEAENYKATIQLMRIVNGKKEEVTDKEGNIYTVDIIGNHSKTFENIPVYKGTEVIEYALEEIRIQRRTSANENEWEDVPITDFSVTYHK